MGFISDNEQKQIIAHNLSYLIEHSGKDQRQISIDLDVNPPTFNQWVKGKAIPSVSLLKKMASYFGVTLSQIVNDTSKESSPDDVNESLSLTDDEISLIKQYRMLSDQDQAQLRQFIRVMFYMQRFEDLGKKD